MEENLFYRNFYCVCKGTLNAYQEFVNEYQNEVDTLRQGLKDYRNSPILVREYRKSLRTAKRHLDNYKHRKVCLEDIFKRYGIKEQA